MVLEALFGFLRDDDELVLAAGPTTALKKLKRIKFDAAILDNNLLNDPHAGLKLKTLIEKNYPVTKCVVVSALPSPGDGVLPKPNTVATLRELIQLIFPGLRISYEDTERRKDD